MAALQVSQPRTRRYSVRYQARLDAETHTKLEELAAAFHRKRSAILHSVMQWGLTQTRGWTVGMAIPGTVRTVSILLEPALLQHVQEAAAAHGTTVAAWVRHAMRQVTIEDFPASWRAQKTTSRSHDSGAYHRRFMLRLNEETSHQ
jgi:predicted transcriptional regulator